MKRIIMGVAVLSTVALTGCASVLNEPTQPVNVIASNGKAFKGQVDGKDFQGPGVVNVQRSKLPKLFTVETEGCAKTTSAANDIDPKFWGNIITGGFLGSTTDSMTEKMWRYQDTVIIQCNG